MSIAAAPDPEFDRAVFAERRRVGKRGEIDRPVGDMHAVEQAVAVQLGGAPPNSCLRRRRNEQHRAVVAVAGDDVSHVAGQKAIAFFFGIEQPAPVRRELLGAERKPARVERRRDIPSAASAPCSLAVIAGRQQSI